MFNKVKIRYERISKAGRSLKYGVGVNDAQYMVRTEQGTCPVYSRWDNMLKRCYSEDKRWVAYEGCTVCNEWLTFSVFSLWVSKQSATDGHLDKDVLKPGNKVYSPNTCVIIPQEINKLLTNHGAKRGKYLEGVCFHKKMGKFVAQISVYKTRRHLGYFDEELQAYKAYVTAKAQHIESVAHEQSDARVKKGLLAHAKLYRNKL